MPVESELGARGRPRRKRRLTVADIAKLRGTSNVAAYRWLLRNAKTHMLMVAGAWTVPAAVVSRLVAAVRIEELISRVANLEERADLLERRVNVLAAGHRG